jgi:transcription elongation factor Elf1
MEKYQGAWKGEYKYNLWFECISKGHLPVVVSYGNSCVSMFCRDCGKVWKLASAGRLSSIDVKKLDELGDSTWKEKVLELLKA